MTRDSRYDILFEPGRIGPVTAKNRFYQVPHCNGTGYRYPHTQAAMRGIQAEGGWAVLQDSLSQVMPRTEFSFIAAKASSLCNPDCKAIDLIIQV